MDMDKVNIKEIFGENVLDYNKHYILYGAGEKGDLILKLLLHNGFNIDFFVDDSIMLQGKKLNGVDIKSSSELTKKDNDRVIITTLENQSKSIKSKLISLGIEKFIQPIFLDFAPFAPNVNILEEIEKNHSNIHKVINLLSDDLSIKTFNTMIEFYKNPKVKYLQDICKSEDSCYFDEDIIKLSDNEIFVDGGSYDFETSIKFISKTNNKYKKIYAFEPDSNNYKKLLTRSNVVKNVTVINKGLSNNTDVVYFKDIATQASRIVNIHDDYTTKVEVDTIDNIVDLPTFIKLDIEGHEINALMGAEKSIKKYKPKLAICAYHKLSDIWEIPLLINSYCPDYKIYMRHYNDTDHSDTICYATL